MAESGTLKRLGGGRWQTRDERFTIEPQSGTWVVVDGERTDELGLPLVRGPFPSLTAARADIEAARSEGDVSSPLASRLSSPSAKTKAKSSKVAQPPATSKAKRAPDEPAWLKSLDGPKRTAARKLLALLTKEGVEDAETVVRSDLIGGQPALTRLAVGRAVRSATAAHEGPDAVAEAVADVLIEGKDRELGVSWRLVDGDGRPIRRLDQA
jgi:hypothetical protein